MSPSFRSFFVGAVNVLAMFLMIGAIGYVVSDHTPLDAVNKVVAPASLPVATSTRRSRMLGKGSSDCVPLEPTPAPAKGSKSKGKGSSSGAPVRKHTCEFACVIANKV